MASYYMIAGVSKSATGSMDTYFDSFSTSTSRSYIYLGMPTGSSNPTASFFTFPAGSRGNPTLKDFQMYTPYPTSTERGKLYFVDRNVFVNDPNIPNDERFVELMLPTGDQYFIVTPSLNNPSFQANGVHIAQYAFVDEDDLFNNGWKVQRGTPSLSDPLASQADWSNLINDPSWLAPPFNLNLANPGDKAQIVANLLALTSNSYTIQTNLGLSASNIIKGAIVLGGEGTMFNDSTFKGLVPLIG